jgi:DNA-binding CsgD family transcriptional regulator
MYTWQPRQQLEGGYTDGMLLTVPLMASDGTALGICGLEVTATLFNLRQTPDTSEFTGALAVLSPVTGTDQIEIANSMVGGRSLGRPVTLSLHRPHRNDGLDQWDGGSGYVGRSEPITLYPRDSVNAGSAWRLSVLVPLPEVQHLAKSNRYKVIWPLVAAAVLGLVVGGVLIRRTVSPLGRAVEQIKSGNRTPTTKIREIDDLFAYLAEQDAERDKVMGQGEGGSAGGGAGLAEVAAPVITDGEFARRLATLTRAETTVFNLYAEGYDAQEVTDLLHLSMNTIKTHNRHIYAKLAVASRRELLAHLRAVRQDP